MKHKKIYLSVALLIGLFSILFSSSVTAWYNAPINTAGNNRTCARYAVNRGEDPVDVYRRHYQIVNDPYNHFYSTHDYIAHFAIDYLSKSDFNGKYLWLSDLNRDYFYIYLLATEYPDYAKYYVPKIILDCGKSTQIKSDFNIGESHKFRPCLGLAERRSHEVYDALYKKDENNNPDPWFETAAFYLGAVTHYVAEMAHPHHASNIGTSKYHAWLESEVSSLTTLEDFRKNGLYGSTFFTINLEKVLGWSPIFDGFKAYDPREAVDKMAKITSLNEETYFGNQNNGSQNAQYFYDFVYKDSGNGRGSGTFDFIEEVGRNGSKLHESLSYLAGNFKRFFDRLEILLNYAVYFTAGVIKRVLRDFIGQVTPCQNSDDDNNPQPSNDERNPPFDSFDVLARYMALIAAFVVVGLVGRRTIGGVLR
jgi:hypothetical protein